MKWATILSTFEDTRSAPIVNSMRDAIPSRNVGSFQILRGGSIGPMGLLYKPADELKGVRWPEWLDCVLLGDVR